MTLEKAVASHRTPSAPRRETNLPYDARRLTRREKLTFVVFAALALLLRAAALFRYRFDSDEQQHLHVTWGWTAGLVQYRDLFDNHAPLFHMLTAPLLALVGERSDVLLWMRV